MLRARNGVFVTRNHMLSDSGAFPYHPPSPADGLALAAGGDHPSGAGGAADPRMPGPETGAGANVTSKRHAKIAQMVEHRIVTPSGAGSTPAFRSKSPDEGTGSLNQPREWFDIKGSGVASRGVAGSSGAPEGKDAVRPGLGPGGTRCRPACCRQVSSSMTGTPRNRRPAAPPLSARGHGRTGLGPHPIPATGNPAFRPHLSRVTPRATHPNPKEIALCDDDDRHDHEKET